MLEVQDLTKRYGEVLALDGCNFSVSRGRIVGFLGPNGAGKTTTMRCIFGLARPDAGGVLWRGREVGREERRRFGYMPEERGLYPRMRVHEQLAYFAELSGLGGPAAAAAADRWLERLGLADRARSRVEELSHGNQQRVQLAVAMAHGPELLVLDEPFSGLDPIGVESVAGLLAELVSEGVTVLFSSHQLDLVEDVCQDVVIIDHGRVVLSGDVLELRASSSRRSLRVTVDGAPWIPSIGGVSVVPREEGRPRVLVDASTDLDEILRLAQQAGQVTQFSFEPPSLSDLFFETVTRKGSR
ncbi:MAG: ATP-binding cassette domain-containing protein [Actinomycetota bacterium]